LQRRQQLVPNHVENRLHVSYTARDGDYRVLLGEHNAELAERSISAIGIVAATPKLVAVALVPVAFGIAAVGRLSAGGCIYPRLRHELLSLPLALLQIELAKAGDVFGANA